VFCGRNGGDGTWDAGEGVMWPGEGRRGGAEREAQREGAGRDTPRRLGRFVLLHASAVCRAG
jgi:hypothetical protein